jgi:hypothetical protein
MYCEIKQKRARDLTNRDVIRHQGCWREVFGVYQSMEDITGEFDLSQPYAQELAEQARKAFEELDMEAYVILRLFVPERSTSGELADQWVTLYRNDLMEVQTLPA